MANKSKPTRRVRRWSDRVKVEAKSGCDGRTQQHMKDDCDINNIMAKYEKNGVIAHLAKYQGSYEDFTVLPDFQTAMNTMTEAQEMFLTIPASIREDFQNDPGKFVEFATNPDNIEKMREYGLAPREGRDIPQAPAGYELPEKAEATSSDGAAEQ